MLEVWCGVWVCVGVNEMDAGGGSCGLGQQETRSDRHTTKLTHQSHPLPLPFLSTHTHIHIYVYLDFIEAVQEAEEGGLAAPARAHHRHRRARGHVEADVVENGARVVVGEVDVLELEHGGVGGGGRGAEVEGRGVGLVEHLFTLVG